jgi:hypothetical protein
VPTSIQTDAWPPLPYAEWRETYAALHLWTQIVGKVRLAQTPWLNHSWQSPLYVTPRGLTTGVIPHGARALALEFDFVDHALRLTTDGGLLAFPLEPMSVADFYSRVTGALADLGVPVRIYATPNEMPDAVPFTDDRQGRPYDRGQAHRFFRALLSADRVLKRFRTGFLGKASPVHFFWGGFDLAATRFSGRRAPPHPGGIPNLPDAITREAYSHEVSSAGFWPGGPGCEAPAFYSYAWPDPVGFRDAAVAPSPARYETALGEFLLPYEAVRTAADPEGLLIEFLQSTYAPAADLGRWDRAALECALGVPGQPRPV